MVVLPGQIIPLHIFEQRYKDLINQCQKGEEFGVNFSSDLGLAVMGCSVKIKSIIKKYEDGTVDLLIEGHRRYKLDKVIGDKSFDQGEVEFIQEEEDLGLPQERIDKFMDLHAKVAKVSGLRNSLAVGDGFLSYKSACDLALDNMQRQTLLELSAEGDRIVWLSDLYKIILSANAEGSKEIEGVSEDPGLGNIH
jgi:Lon protease-like protein